MNLHNGNKTKLNLFLYTFKSDVTYFLSKNIEVIKWLSKSKFLSFITEGNPNNRNETKSDILHGTYSNLISGFNGYKILKYFYDIQNCHL